MTLPEDMRRYLAKANRGELQVRVAGMHEGARAVYAAGRQIIYTAIGLIAGVEALESYRRHEVGLARGLGVTTAAMAVLLLVSSVLGRPKRM